MKALLKTLAIIAFLALATQTIRHAYVLWLEPRASVLDKYDQPLKEQISSANSIDELLRRYEPVRKEVDEAKKEADRSGKQIDFRTETESEPYKSEKSLREAINQWEQRSKEIREIRFFWFFGLLLLLTGGAVYRWNQWAGVTLSIAAFSEFIYWTSPTFLFGGRTQEFDRLLVNKLTLSVFSLILLIAIVQWWRIFADKSEAQ